MQETIAHNRICNKRILFTYLVATSIRNYFVTVSKYTYILYIISGIFKDINILI